MTGTFTPQTAPRDINKLQALGPFMLKRLMEQVTAELRIDFDADKRAAHMRDPIDKRARDVFELLLQLDKGGSGSSSEAASEPAAVEAKTEKPRREPRPSPAVTNGVHAPTAGAASGTEAEAMRLLEGIARIIQGISDSMDAMQKTVASAEKGTKRIADLEASVAKVAEVQVLTLAVLAQLAEAQLGAPFADIAAQCVAEKDSFEKTVESAFGTGK